MDSDSSPPSYARSTATPCPPVLLNLAPLADGTSFQVGGLLGPDSGSPGTAPAAVAGEVQIKFTEGETALLDGASQQQQTQPPPKFARLTVVFKGVETDARGHRITLVEQSRTLWELPADETTTLGAPPAVSRFRIDLTPDLPTCVHLASSSLAYSLTATLYPLEKTTPAAVTETLNSDALPLSRCVPVHLVRSATPAALLPVQSVNVTATDPIRWSVRFPRTVFTRREPIGLVVRVEVPDSKRIGEGLRLRTISAELVRTITTTAVASSQSSVTTLESGREADVQRRTVLAHSGKSARFSPSRPIIIRLVLHPPLEPTCESISQSTIAHHVSFAVVVTVGLVNTASTSTSSSTNFAAAGASTSVSGPASTSHSGPAAHDSVLTQELTILPDLPPSAAALPRSEKQKEVDHDAAAAGAESSLPATVPPPTTGTSAASSPWEEEHPDAPVPSYVEDLLLDPGTAATTTGMSPPPPMASTSAGWTTSVDSPKVPALRRQDSSSLPLFTPTLPPSGYTLSASLEGYDDDGDDEEEYDGYEELSLPASLSERPPPPRIDDDISPPSMAEPSSAFGYRLAADSGEVVIIGAEEGVVRNREVGEEGSALSTAASHDGRMMGGGGASMQELLPHRTTSTTTGEPETPPPPVDYDLPFLSTPAHLPPLPPSSLLSTPPPPPSPPLPAAFSAYAGAPPNDCEPEPIPSSPPPPLSPLDPNHHLVALPPFSSNLSPSSSARAADQSHNDHVSGSPPPPGSGSPEGLPPPYAGRLQSPPPPPATLPTPASPPSTTSSLPPIARVAVPILDAAPPPRRRGPPAAPEAAEHRYYSSPRQVPPPPPSSSGTSSAPAHIHSASTSSQQQLGESTVGGGEDGGPPPPPPAAEDEESRPPPYEQRDDFSASVGGGPSGIQWGMMHTTTTNRRGELVL